MVQISLFLQPVSVCCSMLLLNVAIPWLQSLYLPSILLVTHLKKNLRYSLKNISPNLAVYFSFSFLKKNLKRSASFAANQLLKKRLLCNTRFNHLFLSELKMKKNLLTTIALALLAPMLFAQTNPAITSWLQNTTVTGRYYTVAGGSISIPNNILVNCQKVQYSTNFAYVTCTGIPAYATGPFQDGNPSQASNQNAIFKFPLSPVENTGTKRATTGGNIGGEGRGRQ